MLLISLFLTPLLLLFLVFNFFLVSTLLFPCVRYPVWDTYTSCMRSSFPTVHTRLSLNFDLLDHSKSLGKNCFKSLIRIAYNYFFTFIYDFTLSTFPPSFISFNSYHTTATPFCNCISCYSSLRMEVCVSLVYTLQNKICFHVLLLGSILYVCRQIAFCFTYAVHTTKL